MPKILVTGATGTFGNAVAQQLQEAGEAARVLVRDPAGFELSGFEVAVGNFGDEESLDQALTGIESVFLASFDRGDLLAFHKNVIEAAKRQGVRHLARISTMFVEEPRFASFMAPGLAGERQLEDSGLAFTHLRPSWVLQNFLPTSGVSPVKDGKIRLPAGDGKVGFVDARDVAAVAAKALTEPGHEGRTYELTGPEARSHQALAEALSEATGQSIRFEALDPAVYHQELAEQGWPDK